MVSAKRRVRIGNRGEIALPADFLQKHHLSAGDDVTVEDTEEGALIVRQVGNGRMTEEQKAALFAKPSAEEIVRRQALFAEIMAARKERDIRPMTSTELIHLARAEEGRMDDPGT